MENNNCEYIPVCPIYNRLLKENYALIEIYRNFYCENGKKAKESCARYKVSREIGSCPPNILPNSSKSVSEIISLIEE
ncbi:MAG: hypothetical protein JXB17_00120 [Bacteroidales bacterium]|nr:hypothetical protein [Bacteroidales bacterium]